MHSLWRVSGCRIKRTPVLLSHEAASRAARLRLRPPPPPPQVLLPALRAHVRFLHLHRIAAIVLLRMLQEAAVARDIASHGGVVIMLGMLREHVAEEETVAATVHILYLITHADVMRGAVEVEVCMLYLWRGRG